MQVAVLGLGLLGREVAIRLKNQSFAVTGWNRAPARSQALASSGVVPAVTAAEAVARTDVAVLLLSDAPAIETTLFATMPAPQLAGKALIQMGTIAPDESRRIARRVGAAGGEYLEAPVLGSLPEARAGRLILMAGGDLPLYERFLPLFNALSEAPQRIGEVGQAAALKLAMNQLIAGLTASFSYSLGLVRNEGIDVERFMDLLRASALYAPTFDKKLGHYLGHAYGQANFPLKHLLKDVNLFRRVIEPTRMDQAPLAALEAALSRAIAAGFADADYSALYESLIEGRG